MKTFQMQLVSNTLLLDGWNVSSSLLMLKASDWQLETIPVIIIVNG